MSFAALFSDPENGGSYLIARQSPRGTVQVGRAREGQGVGAWPIRYSHLGDASTKEEPVDLCITQARYTQLHRSIKYSKSNISYLFCRKAFQRLSVAPRNGEGRRFVVWFMVSRCRSCCR
jgi:hypothetical protein